MTLIFEIPELLSEGIIIAITGYMIVFTALVLLYFIFFYLSKGIVANTKRKLAKMGKAHHLRKDHEIHISGEVTAAIAMAIYLNRDLHDTESDVLTIRKISKDYSPWNSKIYGMRYFRR
jgi:Na+-transporting methylmalonyl-CoA/oxaloacetate decarboxylase gamma subunit